MIQGEASDGWTKKVEGLSYLRDDAAVVEVFEQARANWEIENTARFPDYLFARTAKAKNLTLEGDLEAAEALLTPILERERFHVLEFSAFADAYITWLVAKKQWDGARSWFDMWERVNPDDSRLDHWEDKFETRIWIPK